MGKLSLQSRFRVSGFGFRSDPGTLSLQSRFRVSGFGFRVSLVETNSADLSPDHVSLGPGLVAGDAAALCVAGVAHGDIHLQLAW